MYNLEIRLLAQNNIREIVDYYDEIGPHITDAFLSELYSNINLIGKETIFVSRKI